MRHKIIATSVLTWSVVGGVLLQRSRLASSSRLLRVGRGVRGCTCVTLDTRRSHAATPPDSSTAAPSLVESMSAEFTTATAQQRQQLQQHSSTSSSGVVAALRKSLSLHCSALRADTVSPACQQQQQQQPCPADSRSGLQPSDHYHVVSTRRSASF